MAGITMGVEWFGTIYTIGTGMGNTFHGNVTLIDDGIVPQWNNGYKIIEML